MNIQIIKRKAHTFIKNPKTLPIKILYKISPILNDEDYLKLLYRLTTGNSLNLDDPITFGEKLQWLKVYYRKPIMTQMVDKYEAKDYVAQIIGNQYVTKTYGVWDSFNDINFDKLPSQFVLKTTHDQGGVIVVADKDKLNEASANRKLTHHLNTKHYYLTREWPYKNVKPRIIAEQLIVDHENNYLKDYKFLCFNGEPKVMYIKHKDNSGYCFDFFDMDFNRLEITDAGYPNSDLHIEKPSNWDSMICLAKKLSKGWPHIRVDFYSVKDQIYFGELTFFTRGGIYPYTPNKWNYILGEWINLEELNQ